MAHRGRWGAFAAGLCLSAGARAGELDAFTGRLKFNTDDPTTYTWGIEYRQPLADHWNAGFVWLNEGHRPHDHRDGQAVQLWWHTQRQPRGLVFDAGLGPYRYYDTRLLTPDPDFQNKHGWGLAASASVNWYFESRWFSFLRLNQVDTGSKYDSTALSVGLGYRFAPSFGLPRGGEYGAATPAGANWEVDGLAGERIGNTAHSEVGGAETIDLRRRLSDHFTASVSLVAGQGTRLGWREGFAAELWLEQSLTPRFRAGAGAGAFIVSADDTVKDTNSPANLAAMVSVTLAYAVGSAWETRVTWHRVGTGDDHDCDIVLFGAGYRF